VSETSFGGVRHGSKRGLGYSDKNNARRDAICVEEGGTGFTYARIPGEGWRGWFTGPNLGDPFDGNLAKRVLARCKQEGL
jgi:hypothetical protein